MHHDNIALQYKESIAFPPFEFPKGHDSVSVFGNMDLITIPHAFTATREGKNIYSYYADESVSPNDVFF